METLNPFPLPAEDDDPAAIHELVVHRAEEIWRSLDRPPNRDLAIWLEAEAEIRAMRERTFRHPHCPLES